MPPLLHRLPLKAIFIPCAILHLLVVLFPTWAVIDLPVSRRPFPTWSLRRCFLVRFIRWILVLSWRTNLYVAGEINKAPSAWSLWGTSSSFVWIPPLAHKPVGCVGQWVRETGTQAIKLPAYWIGIPDTNGRRDFRAKEGEKVMMNFHGGGYIMGSAHPKDYAAYMSNQLWVLTTSIPRILSIEYRISSSAPNPSKNAFPAALVDALSAFYYLLSLGFPPHNIYICGDSAGANLALALTRYLVDNGIEPPGALVLFSPWCDLTDSHIDPDSSFVRNIPTDFLSGETGEDGPYAVRSFIGGIPASNPYISPACRTLEPKPSFVGFPRTYISVGGGELFRDGIRTLGGLMKDDVEGDVVFDEVPGAIHDFCVLWFMEPERTETLRRIADWLDDD